MTNFSTKEKRDIEENLYSIVIEEIESGNINKALWVKSLVETNNNKELAQTLYIKLRIQKIKDELLFKKEEAEMKNKKERELETKKAKNSNSLLTLETTFSKIKYNFKWLTIIMLFLGIIGLFFSYISFDINSDYSWQIICLLSVCFTLLSVYLFYNNYKINKTRDYKVLKKKINSSFLILIPFSLISTTIGILLPLLGLAMVFAFIILTSNAIRFNLAYRHAIKNKLI